MCLLAQPSWCRLGTVWDWALALPPSNSAEVTSKLGNNLADHRMTFSKSNIVIGMMDRIDEARPLSHVEYTLRSLVRDSTYEHTARVAAYWKQRGKIRTCTLGDDNTKFFHLPASDCWRCNQIKSLMTEHGAIAHAHDAKASILYPFYNQLLG